MLGLMVVNDVTKLACHRRINRSWRGRGKADVTTTEGWQIWDGSQFGMVRALQGYIVMANRL